MIKTCQFCGDPLNTPGIRTRRKYCNETCRVQHQQTERQHRMDEFKWIAGTDTWPNIAERIGLTSVKALREWLRTHGETSWADRVVEDTSERPRQGRWAA
jgi:hypothetical protein